MRPNSLLVALSPVMIGASLGYRQSGKLDLPLVFLALVAALLMQVITNLQNDVGYTQRGADMVGKRLGLPRATALGWLTAREVKVVIAALSICAIGLGGVLVAMRGWPVVVLGAASLFAALAYMGGPRPIAYTPWGELTVWIFFGPVAVLGTGWLLTGGLSMSGFWASMATGSLSAAALAVNNYRDMAHDRLVGRKTMAVVLGANGAQRWLGFLLAMPFVAVVAMVIAEQQVWPLLALAVTPVAWGIYQDARVCTGGLAFNPILFRTFKLGIWFATLLSIGAVL